MTDSNREIDLIELYQKTLVFLFKNILTFVIFISIGLLLGVTYHIKKANLIKTHFLAETSDISKELVFMLSEKVAFDLDTKNYDELQKDLNINQSILESIKSIEIDTTKDVLNIAIISSSKESLLPFTKALVHYYNHQDYILNKQKLKREETQELLNKIEEEINTINKFQEQFFSNNKVGNVTINQIDGLHNEKLRLFQMKQECEKTLKQTDAIQLIDTNNNIIRNNSNLIKELIIATFLSILFAFIYFFIRFSIALKNKA